MASQPIRDKWYLPNSSREDSISGHGQTVPEGQGEATPELQTTALT